MIKNLITFLLLAIIVAVGLGYSVYRDPELPSLTLFNQVMTEFSSNANQLEAHFKQRSTLTDSNETFSFNYIDENKATQKIVVNMLVSNQIVTLTIADGDWPLANQSIILEPYSKNQQIRWKCINGSVLVRFRSKDCRLGYGVLLSELK